MMTNTMTKSMLMNGILCGLLGTASMSVGSEQENTTRKVTIYKPSQNNNDPNKYYEVHENGELASQPVIFNIFHTKFTSPNGISTELKKNSGKSTILKSTKNDINQYSLLSAETSNSGNSFLLQNNPTESQSSILTNITDKQIETIFLKDENNLSEEIAIAIDATNTLYIINGTLQIETKSTPNEKATSTDDDLNKGMLDKINNNDKTTKISPLPGKKATTSYFTARNIIAGLSGLSLFAGIILLAYKNNFNPSQFFKNFFSNRSAA